MESNSTFNVNSVLSFQPLIREWEKLIREGREGTRQQYQDLLDKVRQYPELLEPIHDLSVIKKHKGLVEQMMATIFPMTLSDKEDLFGASIPFDFTFFYSSEKVKDLFLAEDECEVIMPDTRTEEDLCAERKAGFYSFILGRLYNMEMGNIESSIHPLSSDTGLAQYLELELDTRFIDVHVKGELPELPIDFKYGCHCIDDVMAMPEIEELLPMDKFEFRGMTLVRARDVTGREVLNAIRNRLLHINSFSDMTVFNELQVQVRNLLGVPNVFTAIKPFFRVNNHLVLSELYTSVEYKGRKYEPSPEKLHYLHQAFTAAFKDSRRPLLIPEINEDAVMRYPFIVIMAEMGWRSAIICPLFADNREMLGVLIITSQEKNKFLPAHIGKIEPAIPLFKLALEKSQESLDHQVDRVIKEQFTAVQDAVEWRFTEAALSYLTNKNKGEGEAKIEPIVFEGVYPMYGAIDIRNSSVERNHSIQLDLLEQLNSADAILQLAKKENPFPLLDETSFRIRKYIHSVSNILFADEEISILQFMKVELVQLLKHLQLIMPSLNKEINKYFAAVNSPVEMVYHHRKKYEDSITIINNEVARFIDQEQQLAQKIFPHYFERFVTDGVDFNIYIGQSISPDRKFDFFYLKNLKIWQLTTLARAAQLTHSLESKLSMPLQTSQLILAHSHPISISFRTAERKFDVDGAYNIRYEIIKKRIDKVHVKDSNERLTKPGTLAIVYSQPQEAQEYLEYISFLQNQGILKEEIEKFDLEELQGVSGLKGLRVGVVFEEKVEKEGKKERVAAEVARK